MQEIALCFSILLSGILIGTAVLLYRDIHRAMLLLKEQTKEFDLLMKEASEANNSFANKILHLEEKVDSVEFWRQNTSKSNSKAF